MKKRFRGFLPIVVDIETAGFDPQKDAVLEIAVVLLDYIDGKLVRNKTFAQNILPFDGANINPSALEFNGIKDPWYPLRYALKEKEALSELFIPIKAALKKNNCHRAILVGHNAWFDLHFLNATIKRTKTKSPFHAFSSIDTASLGMLVYGHSVLAELVKRSGMDWQNEHAHSAIYDAEKTADLFCQMVNKVNLFGSS